MTMTEKMKQRASTFERRDQGQVLDQELLHMILAGLVKVGTMRINGGIAVLRADLTDEGKIEVAKQP